MNNEQKKTSSEQSKSITTKEKAVSTTARLLNSSEAKLVGGAISVRVPPKRGAGQG